MPTAGNQRRIAILGAGGVGACAALELASRGYAVDLYDENARVLTQASRNNEGKVHVGLVYAKDRSLETAKTMIVGAVHFTAYLARWIDIDPADVSVSSPFYYAVHRETMVEPEELEAHYQACKRLFADACSATGLTYLDLDRTLLVEKVSAADMESLVCPDHFVCVYRTSERAVDVRAIGDRLHAAVQANPLVRFIANARICDAAWVGRNRVQVTFRRHGSEHTEVYDVVANTLWHGRLEIDSKLHLFPERRWIYRYKLGGWIDVPAVPRSIPSLTIVLGPFGDVVNFERRGLYFSWYPSGMIGTSGDPRPPEWGTELSATRRRAILRDSHQQLSRLCPELRSLEYSDDLVDPAGGVIFAWGSSDIDDRCSRLHTRHEIGIHSVGSYHSVNTGKYTMVPYLGYKTAERVLGLS